MDYFVESRSGLTDWRQMQTVIFSWQTKKYKIGGKSVRNIPQGVNYLERGHLRFNNSF